jgi:uncharacterized cupin superfamily protein
VEATAEPLAYGDRAPRPANILNIDEAEHESWKAGIDTALLATRERSTLAGLHWETIAAGRRGAIPHCHSAEEEVFVMLEGTATLELWQRDGSIEETPLRAGHVVARPPGTGISHSFRAGPDGVTMLIYGTRVADDACWYPRSRKIGFGGLGVIGRIETLDYLDGEPIDDD